MLKNIIFDMGNVLIRYEPEYFIDRLGIESNSDRRLLLNSIFRSPDWPLLDRGELSEDELETRVRERLPERLHDYAHQLIFEWDVPIEPVPGMADFIADCKRAGTGVYLLSNASLRQREYWNRIPGHEHFDGRVVSAEVRCVKPMPEIYRYLVDTYKLDAQECLFVDDVWENINAAEQVGIRGFLFTGNVETLRSEVCMPGIAAFEGEVRR